MENKPDIKLQEDNKMAEPQKQPARGEYGDKPFQNPYFSDKPTDQTKTDPSKETVEIDLEARRREEEDPKFAANQPKIEEPSAITPKIKK